VYSTPVGTVNLRLIALTLLTSTYFIVSPVVAQVIHPTKIAGTDATALATPDVQKNKLYKWRVMGRSADKNLRAGLASTTIQRSVNDGEPNPVDEFLFVVKGRERYTSLDGTVLEVGVGEAVFVPKGWRGKWETFGTVEFYVIYDPDKSFPEQNSSE
jgi:uncharacterized cupin superfamily protein